METWKPIPGYSDHDVSNLGGVRSRTWGRRRIPLPEPYLRTLSVVNRHSGIQYHVISIRDDSGKPHTHYVHELVALAHIGPRPIGLHVCHGPDNNGLNNAVTNLRYDTQLANVRESRATKLSLEDVLAIRQRHARGETPTQLANFFPVCRENIRLICAGQSWQVA
jgi:hypothetical protein